MLVSSQEGSTSFKLFNRLSLLDCNKRLGERTRAQSNRKHEREKGEEEEEKG
jgi:hypothetical protein